MATQMTVSKNTSVEDKTTGDAFAASLHHNNTHSLTALTIDISNTNHEYLKKALPVLLSHLQSLAATQGDQNPVLRQLLARFTTLKEDIEMHIQKEELIIFPRIKEMEKFYTGQSGRVVFSATFLEAPTTLMEQEHHQIEKSLAVIKELSNQYTAPPGACTSFEHTFSLLHTFEKNLLRHIEVENKILFPKALVLFKKCQAMA